VREGLSQAAVSFDLFFQIFARRAKIWKNKSLRTLLPQANLADEYAIAQVLLCEKLLVQKIDHLRILKVARVSDCGLELLIRR
jgi:hypothetical protein